ncbi:T6SS protein Cts1T [Enterobacteriaceae bacterium H20N1]|uniref:T6SS protein Cts1T n=1 Tax=Dryocola boscaweniae TaxID=2925397 RepID=A0A9X3AC94_9ENTR|nr:T6SS protein Cts1T [Dryocola boscaweniae]MCT4703384.1 T6SS protein Cts1T [Dryocola boscaweniae]MCT4715776.1 T6SS protein Cts1T [Dryocola boscaweniae]MCT4720552.1 T6SS protein Cts1T [Dryocola boscaweniae]
MSLRLYLLVDDSRAGLFKTGSKRRREVYSLVTQKILKNMDSSMPDDYLPESYPWCFVISFGALRGKCYAGAFMVHRNSQGEKSLIVVYSERSYQWLKKNMRTEFPLTFWMARILNNTQKSDFTQHNWKPLRQWLKALKRAYSPFWESFALTPAYRFKNHSQALLREGSQEDYCIRNSDGVEVMPWTNWPDCLQQEAGIWIWRQSRHRKILDSQRIPLRRAEAEPPAASF